MSKNIKIIIQNIISTKVRDNIFYLSDDNIIRRERWRILSLIEDSWNFYRKTSTFMGNR